MEKITSLVFIVGLLIIFSSVVSQASAKICVDGLNLGSCENCAKRCKAKHGRSTESNCDHGLGIPLCTCYYQCPSSSPSLISRKTCNGGAGLCSQRCPEKCCDMNCAQRYNGGHGFCNTLGTFSLCQCEYPC